MLHISDESSALLKFLEINSDYDYIPLLNYALKHNHFASDKEAHRALVGLQQWMACHLHPANSQAPMLMLRGPVALMYDVMVKHGNYEGFCHRYFGTEIKRHDVNIEKLSELTDMKAVLLMLERISSAFREDCVEALQEWVADRRQPQILFYSSTDKPLIETCYLYPKEEGRIKSAA